MDHLSQFMLKALNALEAEGRHVKRQVWLTALSLILVCIAGAMLLVAAVAAIAALFLALKEVVGAPWALAICSFLFALCAAVVGAVGIWVGREPSPKPDETAAGADQAGAAGEAFAALTQAGSEGRKILESHPWAAVAMALGLGFLISSSETARRFIASVVADLLRGMAGGGSSDKPAK